MKEEYWCQANKSKDKVLPCVIAPVKNMGTMLQGN